MTSDNELVDTDSLVAKIMTQASENTDLMINGTAISMFIQAVQDERNPDSK